MKCPLCGTTLKIVGGRGCKETLSRHGICIKCRKRYTYSEVFAPKKIVNAALNHLLEFLENNKIDGRKLIREHEKRYLARIEQCVQDHDEEIYPWFWGGIKENFTEYQLEKFFGEVVRKKTDGPVTFEEDDDEIRNTDT